MGGGAEVRAAQLATLLELIVNEMQNMNEVSFPSMSRCVVLDGFLRPLAKKLLEEAEACIPELEDYDPELDDKDPRPGKLDEFDSQVGHVTDRSLVEEAKRHFKDKLDADWLKVKQINDAFGEQIKETTTETREIL